MVGLLIDRMRRARRDPGLAVLEGFHALKHALRFGAEIEVALTCDRRRVRALAEQLAPELADTIDTLLVDATPEAFARACRVPPREPVMALARRIPANPAAMLTTAVQAPLVVLQRPTHLPNVGAVVRVAAAAGAAGVLVLGGQDPWHPTAVRTAAGLQFALPCARVDELPDTQRPIVAAAPGGIPMHEAHFPADALLLFGSERRGISPELLHRAGSRVTIPMRSGVSSLNLATAVAVFLYARG